MTTNNLQKIKDETIKIQDSLGCPIDSGILDVVVNLRVLRFETTGSCEGHLDWGCANPWVDIGSKKDVSKLLEEMSRLK